MKIALYSRVFQPQVGGVETIVRALAEGLAKKGGNEVTVMTAAPGDPAMDAALPFRVVRRPSVLQLAKEMRRADVVHLAGPAVGPLVVALLFARRVVVEHHGFQAACPNGQLFFEPDQSPCPGHFMAGRHAECRRCNAATGALRSWQMWLLTFVRRWLCRLADANIAPTRALGSTLALPRTTTVFHGISIPPAAASRVPAPVPTFVFLGRLVTTKGVPVLLHAAHQLRQAGAQFRLRVIGDGPERGRLEEMSRSLALQDCVDFLGALDDRGVEASVRDATAVVMPSLGGEVFGLVAAENMARGVPVVASGLGSLAEVVGEPRLVFPPGDSAALAGILRTLIDDAAKAAALSAQARARAEREFALETMIDKHLAVYRN